MAERSGRCVGAALHVVGLLLALGCCARENAAEELYRDSTTTGRSGGWLQTALRTEPKTLNPVTAIDTASLDVIGRIHSDLIHINRLTLQPEPALASSWSVSSDGRVYTLNLRRGIRFSDGQPMDADDVVFTFNVHLNESTGSVQRDLLMVQGKPIVVRKLTSHTVQFELAAPYASTLRLFDSVPILPRHLLGKAYKEGRMARAWGLETPPDQIAGLGPFRLKSNTPGERVILERNPYFWKADRDGRRLPYLDGIVFHHVPNEQVQVVRLLAGELSIVDRVSAGNYLELKKREKSGIRVYNAGPGLEYQFLFFNLNPVGVQANPAADLRRKWFGEVSFRRAVSRAIDRQAITRLVYHGLADPIWGHVTPGNRVWLSKDIPRKTRSLDEARELLRAASFSWKDGALHDAEGNPVAFSLLVSSSNVQRVKIATVVQDDLRRLGMKVSVVALESRSFLDRVLKRLDYDAALMALDSGDVDPNSEMNVWSMGGTLHLWNMSGTPREQWERDIDRLMKQQMTTLDADGRKALYDRVQQLAADNLPIICLSSPHVLLAASDQVSNFQPSILRPSALWSAETLYLHDDR